MTILPLLILMIAAVFLLTIMTAVDPIRFATLMAFFTVAFPKAGIKEGSFPFPVFLALFAIAVTVARVTSSRSEQANRAAPARSGARLLLLIYVVVILVRLLYVLGTAGIAVAAPLTAWALVPIGLYIAASGFEPTSAIRMRRSMHLGFIVAAVIGIAQQIFGVLVVQLEGLTYAYGDDITRKHNVIFGVDGVDTSKIPSTYQNGNIFGLVAAVFASLALYRICSRRALRLDFVVFAAGLSSVGFSGSRTALIALLLAGGYVIFAQRGALGPRIRMVSVALLAGAAVLALRPDLAARYSYSDLASSGGSGRSELWANELSRFTTLDYLIGVRPWRDFVDGWVGIIMQIGIVGAALLLLLVLATRPCAAIRAPLLVLLFGMVFDGSYALFPTIFVPAVLLGVEQMLAANGRIDGTAKDVRAGQEAGECRPGTLVDVDQHDQPPPRTHARESAVRLTPLEAG